MTQGSGYQPPGPPMTGFPGFPGIQQPQQPAQGQPQYPQQQGYPPPAPPYPGQPAPGYGPPPQQPGYQPGAPPGGYPPPGAAYGQQYAQPGAPPQGFPGPQAQGIQPRARSFSGQDMAGVRMAGARHPFMTCRDASSASQWLLEVVKTEQTDRKGSFCVEFRVHWTNMPGVEPGAMRAWIQSCNDLDIALPAIKRFVISALGYETEEQALGAGHRLDELYSAITNANQHLTHPATQQPLAYGPNPLKGRFVNCSVNPPGQGFNNQGRPKVFQRHDFSPKTGQ